MVQFEIGKTYSMKSPCMSSCVWTYEVIARTEKTITITDGEEVKRCRISKQLSAWDDHETVLPLGRFSMCPVLRA